VTVIRPAKGYQGRLTKTARVDRWQHLSDGAMFASQPQGATAPAGA